MSPERARRQRDLMRLYMQADVELTPHAVRRRVEHGISEDDLLTTVVRPEQTYGSPVTQHGPDRRTYQRGATAVVVDERLRQVVTVLPRVQDRWRHTAP